MSQEQVATAKLANKVTAGLLAGVVLCMLLAVGGFLWVGGSQERTPFLNVEILPQEQEQQQALSHEALERPLFWMSRRPVEPVESSEPEQPVIVETLEGVQLLGIMAQKNNYMALFVVDGQVVRVRKGMKLKQWTVTGLTDQEVTLKAGANTRVIRQERQTHQSIKLEL